ncbi:MAG: hypothetical protein ACKPKO_17005, partial [Candidatus Fonsibacter sp.]
MDIKHGDPECCHDCASPELTNVNESFVTVHVVAREMNTDGSISRLDLGNDVLIAYGRRSRGDRVPYFRNDKNMALRVIEAASCLHTSAHINEGDDRWLIGTG